MRADSDECGDGKRGMGRGQAETEACHDIDNPTAHELQRGVMCVCLLSVSSIVHPLVHFFFRRHVHVQLYTIVIIIFCFLSL